MGPVDLRKKYGTSGQNEAITVSTSTGEKLRLISATANYSAAPTQAGVTVVLESGLGAGYNTTLLTGDEDAQSTILLPTNDIIIDGTDAFKVTAPAGGGVITCSVEIRCERVL